MLLVEIYPNSLEIFTQEGNTQERPYAGKHVIDLFGFVCLFLQYQERTIVPQSLSLFLIFLVNL